MKPGFKSTEFLVLPVVLAAMVETPEIAWPMAVAYGMYAVARAATKMAGETWKLD